MTDQTDIRDHAEVRDQPDPSYRTDVRGQPDGSDQPAAGRRPTESRDDSQNGHHGPLFDQATTGDLKGRWSSIQADFVDEPRAAVKKADALVGEVVQRLTSGFARERETLEQEWSEGKDVSTEELRQAIRRYRSFFDRLLSL